MTQEAAPLTARQEQGSRSREEILDAAESLMGARGYAATSISVLSKESGLPASSIYWHFGSKSGVLGAVMERGSRRFFHAIEAAQRSDSADPRERLAALLQRAAQEIHAQPQFLRLFIALLLGSEGDDAQHDVVASVRAEGARLLRQGLEHCYAPWGDAAARQVAADLGDIALVLFDGLFIAGQASECYDQVLVNRAAGALHYLAEEVRLCG